MEDSREYVDCLNVEDASCGRGEERVWNLVVHVQHWRIDASSMGFLGWLEKGRRGR